MAYRSYHPDVVVITGASAGVGRATAQAFARRGARIGLIARDADRLQATAEEVRRLGGVAEIHALDVADAAGVDRVAEEFEQKLGPIDIWVNNAMLTVFSPVMEMTADEFRRVTEVTYLGYVHGTLAALRRMAPRDRGTIVQVGSALSYRSIPLQSAYCAAKHAVNGFTDSLRVELLHDKSRVQVTAVHLPGLNTPQFVWGRSHMPKKAQPVPPIYQPEVAADAIVRAAYGNRREWWLGWPTVASIVGQRVMPEFLDWYLARTNFEAQQTDQPDTPDRPNNLFLTVPGDYGAHGPFDQRAKATSPQWELSKHRGLAVAALLALAFLIFMIGLAV